mmetsp:Transcript_16873/g.26336  ORF Transcript_16873/g.26336 Transcript_16873/m.26336 type:complete len:310 (-) Transcript_16873:141-1070(-)|eukprot:CAMPEP_0196813294 /NCGR_PEP_ID=MMETSP1362-20130617/35520_1 /TAXON_ID=163516 /ORGANISM="Leptocylindrus danicus, Strain CCMP1856" /LENGTH=309 /DNA_ID=CAMNT_0042189433 /DNA_START=49 /DNA_END=978 /DNA_ORIENTATION=-
MSTNRAAVNHVLQSYVKSKVEDGEDSAIDILRMLQSEAKLLFEREVVLNNLDADLFGIFKDEDKCDGDGTSSPLRSKIKESISVISHDKSITREGYISIEAVIQLKCAETLLLAFSFEKQHISYCCGARNKNGTSYSSLDEKPAEHIPKKRKIEEDACKIGTHISYNIFMGKGYDKKDCLLSVEIKASGKDPSTEEHIAACDEDDDGDELDLNREKDFRFLFIGDGKDRFLVRLNPEQLTKFFEWSEFQFNDFFPDCVHFLLTFPYFENEWDIVGYVEDVVLGDDCGSSNEGVDQNDYCSSVEDATYSE